MHLCEAGAGRGGQAWEGEEGGGGGEGQHYLQEGGPREGEEDLGCQQWDRDVQVSWKIHGVPGQQEEEIHLTQQSI